MYGASIELAISKARDDAEREALRPVLAAAIALDAEERTFPARIDANKALRGEGPTKLSKRKRAEVDSYAEDARELEAQQLGQFAEMNTASEILACLAAGLAGDIVFWSKAHTKAHPSDAPLVAAFAQAKVALHDAIAAFEARHRG